MLTWEDIGGLKVAVSRVHRFGTDAFLLADFCRIRKNEKACDLGTGCGIIPLLWQRGPVTPHLSFGVELQAEAVELLSASIAQNGLEGRLYPLHADLTQLDGLLQKGSYDIVSCNPPYKAPGSGLLNPHDQRRTARHEVSCTLEQVCQTAAALLRYGGRLCLCQRPQRLADVFAAMRAAGLEPKRLRFVQKRPETPPWLLLCEATRGGKPFLTVEPPLFVQNEAGGFSAELLQIYGQAQPQQG